MLSVILNSFLRNSDKALSCDPELKSRPYSAFWGIDHFEFSNLTFLAYFNAFIHVKVPRWPQRGY